MNFELDAFLPNQKELIKVLGLNENEKVQKVIDTSFMHYMKLNMPQSSESQMVNSVRNPKGGLIIVNTPYAHYQNEGILYVNPEHNAPGYPIYENGVLIGYKGYKGKRVPSNKKLKNYYNENGGPGRGAHFAERTANNNFNDILNEAQKELDR